MGTFREEKRSWISSLLERSETLVFITYCLIAGCYLFLIPWSTNWEENIFFNWFEVLGHIGRNPAVRGGISGVGAVLILLGLIELFRALSDLLRK